MYTRDYRDIVGGTLLAALGLFVALYATRTYELGALHRIGPGMFPTALGYLLAILGILILVPALFRAGTLPKISWRPFAACLVGVLLFALSIDRFGMVPAIMALVVASVLADNKIRLTGAFFLAGVFALIGVVIFSYGFGMNVPLFAWRV